MYQTIVALALASVMTGTLARAENGVREISGDWQPAGLHPIKVSQATASSTLSSQYAAALATDGQRGTKWVACVAPSRESPQSITLELLGPQFITAVAVFGERVDNDGIVDGAIQVAGANANAFSTVAEITNARSGSWLAQFEPVQASAVRLLVTRAGGPTTHTDIYEIMVFGRPLAPDELKARAADHLAAARRQIDAARAAAAKLDRRANRVVTEVTGDIATLARQLDDATSESARWGLLTDAQRARLAERIDAAMLRAQRLPDRMARVAGIWRERGAAIALVRAAAEKEGVAADVVVGRAATGVRLISDGVVVDLDEADGTWAATWRGAANAAVRRVGFVVEVDGEAHHPGSVAAEVQPVADKLGSGLAIVQRWGTGLAIERRLHVYRHRPAVVVSATITNTTDHDVVLGTARMVDVSANAKGWWYAGQALWTPAVVTVAGTAELTCAPAGDGDGDGSADGARDYDGSGVLVLAHPAAGALAVGYLTGQEAQPDLHAQFRPVDAGTALSARQRFLGRKLPPGATLQLDPVYVAAHTDPFEALEHYGDAVAASSRLPVRKGPTSLWCSWYAHRMAMTEQLVLANAAAAARHFQPLGMRIIQLDHGWQRADVTGDWVANERFPHGLQCLAEQLASRYGLQLGLWIAPTDVADVSQTFREHPEWMLQDEQGRPRVNWRWYWVPNPNCYQVDASQPAGARFIEETFARLSAAGARYYKIDFIAACGGEHFRRHDPYCTPGWGVLRRAMESVRAGAGPDAWIRYCQTPPLLSVGLANSAYGGADTSDSGTPGVIETLRANARSLAAGYWINERLYQREVCDMSVDMRGPLWEAQLKMTMMCLAGCSVSFSDELQYLPPSRIRMMQRCLPPGGPAMRPVDLLHRSIPSIWHVHCARDFGQWEVVGLLNFDDEPRERTVEFAAVGVDDATGVLVFEAWNEEFLGVHRDRVTVALPPRTSRILYLHRQVEHPQVIGTDMHLLGGYHEMDQLAWDAGSGRLAGRCRRMPGVAGRLYIHVPDGYRPRFGFPLTDASARLTAIGAGVWMHELQFSSDSVAWSLPFDGPKP